MYVADRGNDRVAVFDLDGACLNLIGSGTGQAPRFLQVGVCLSDVCMYTYIYKITYIYVCTYTSICVYVYACVAFSLASAPPTRPALCRYICVYVHLNIYIHLYVHMYMYICIYIYITCVYNFRANKLNYREVYASLLLLWGLLQEFPASVHIQILHMYIYISIMSLYMHIHDLN